MGKIINIDGGKKMYNDISQVLATKEIISQKVEELGRRISEDYIGKDLIVVGVLNGAFIFMADLIRHITIPMQIDFISVSSYGKSTMTSGVVKITKDTDISMENKSVVIIEDIVDTGLTLRYIKDIFKTRNPESVKVCTIFDKPSRRKVDIEIEYPGICVPDKFIVGYGLDYAGRYRNLPDICVLKEDIYANC